jgi:hypothetical protein
MLPSTRHRPIQDRRKVARYVGYALGQRAHVTAHHAANHLVERGALVRNRAGYDVIEDGSERETSARSSTASPAACSGAM